MRRWIVAAILLSMGLPSLSAEAQPPVEPPPGRPINPSGAAPAEPPSEVELKNIVDRLVIEFASRRAADAERVDADKKVLFARLATQDGELRAALAAKGLSAKKVKELEGELAKVNAERQTLIDQMAEQDQRFAREIAEYRRSVASIANSPDPRKRSALERYAAGERRGAYAALREIQQAETHAVAAGWREIAYLGLDLKDRGEATLEEVIADFEMAKRLDARDMWVWIRLKRLYVEGGRLEEARHAAEEAFKVADSDRDRAASATELGDLLLKLGDLASARSRHEESLEIAQRLVGQNPASAEARRDLSVSLNKLGDLLTKQGDLASARSRYEESLEIRQRVARENPSSAEAQRDLSVSLNKVGALLVQLGDLASARSRFEEDLELAQRLSLQNPSSEEAQRDLSVSLLQLGDLLMKLGDLASARSRFTESLALCLRLARQKPSSAEAQRDLTISLNKLGDLLFELGELASARDRYAESVELRQQLARQNSSSAEAQRDLGVSLEKLGNVLVRLGDLASARGRYEESLEIRQRLARQNPSSAEAQRDVLVSYTRIFIVTQDSSHLVAALEIAEKLHAEGRLAPSDEGMLEFLRKLVAEKEAKP